VPIHEGENALRTVTGAGVERQETARLGCRRDDATTGLHVARRVVEAAVEARRARAAIGRHARTVAAVDDRRQLAARAGARQCGTRDRPRALAEAVTARRREKLGAVAATVGAVRRPTSIRLIVETKLVLFAAAPLAAVARRELVSGGASGAARIRPRRGLTRRATRCARGAARRASTTTRCAPRSSFARYGGRPRARAAASARAAARPRAAGRHAPRARAACVAGSAARPRTRRPRCRSVVARAARARAQTHERQHHATTRPHGRERYTARSPVHSRWAGSSTRMLAIETFNVAITQRS
jgi:hypothetical protein